MSHFPDSPLYSCGTAHGESGREHIELEDRSIRESVCSESEEEATGFTGKAPNLTAVRRGPVSCDISEDPWA